MIIDFIVKSKIYIFALVILGLIFFGISFVFHDFIVLIDDWFIKTVSENIVNDGLTQFMKVITNLGGVLFFVSFLIVVFLVVSNKKIGYCMFINLLIAYIFSVLFKNIFRRSRPLIMLIEKPIDFSFPSGHTMCSIVFYGFLIYVVSKFVKNVNIKRVINIILIIIIFLVPFSRLYLGVHFFTDIFAGMILGIVCLLMFINYVKIKELL